MKKALIPERKQASGFSRPVSIARNLISYPLYRQMLADVAVAAHVVHV
jgi:hypothetical protein